MYHALIITERESGLGGLLRDLNAEDVDYKVTSAREAQELRSLDTIPDVVLLDADSLKNGQTSGLATLCHRMSYPVVTLLTPQQLNGQFDLSKLNADDFIVHPFRKAELLARLKQAIFRVRGPMGQRVIKVGDLLIDQDRYEVSVANRKVRLTYKEYQLLVVLASHPGRVYTRENLLSLVWGYDYFGGMRTVDVHIRRLRANIEDSTHSFIETVWNVGYRFKSI